MIDKEGAVEIDTVFEAAVIMKFFSRRQIDE